MNPFSSPPIFAFIAENLDAWPVLWGEAKTVVVYTQTSLLLEVVHVQKPQLQWHSSPRRRVSVGTRYSVVKVPYRLYPISCILLE